MRRGATATRVAAAVMLVSAVGVAGGSPATGATLPTKSFRTPSHNIVCLYQDGQGASVFCAIKSGLNPPPPRKRCTEGDPTDRFILMTKTGRPAAPSCWGDPGPLVYESAAPVLRYGRSRVWAGGALRCRSEFRGLTCRNARGHGFFLSKQRSTRF